MRLFGRRPRETDSAALANDTVARPPGVAQDAPAVVPRGVGKLRVLVAAVLCLASGAVSGLLLLQHHGEPRAVAAVKQVCDQAEQSGCEVVARSRYSAIRGVPLAAVGLFFYTALGLLLLLGTMAGPDARNAAATLALVSLLAALVIDLILLGVQMVAIRAFCRLCLLTYALTAMAVVMLVPARRGGRRLVGGMVRHADGRLAFTGWFFAVLALAAAVAAAEVSLDYRERARATGVLGSPLGPTTGPAGSQGFLGPEAQRYQEEARAAAEQARRLQEILDDPAKLERYFADKAAHEFDQAPVQRLKLDGVPFKGPANAPIRVVEFSDFLCPFCRNIAQAFTSYLPGSGGRVAVHYKNYPLDQSCNPHIKASPHSGACLLALGGICAQDQGKFWPYHDRVFATELKEPKAEDVSRLAAEAGLDAGTLETCLRSASARDRLKDEIDEGNGAGVQGTPTLFINGKRLPRINDFTETVEREAKRLGLPPLPQR